MNAAAMLLLERREFPPVTPPLRPVTGPAETRLQAALLGALVTHAMLSHPQLESLSLHLNADERPDGQGKVYEWVKPGIYELTVSNTATEADYFAAKKSVERLLESNIDGLQQVLLYLLDERGDEFLPFHRGQLAGELFAGELPGRWSGWTTFSRCYPKLADLLDTQATRAMSVVATADSEAPTAGVLPIAVAAKAGLDALQELDNWLVCAAIATDADMAQSFPQMQKVAEAGAEALRFALEAPAGPTDALSDDQLLEALRARGYVITPFSKNDFDFLNDSDDEDITNLTPDELAAVKQRAIEAAEESLDDMLGRDGAAYLIDWWDEHKHEVLASAPLSDEPRDRQR